MGDGGAQLLLTGTTLTHLDFTDNEWTNLKMLREATCTAEATTAEAKTDETQMDAQAGEGQYNDSG